MRSQIMVHRVLPATALAVILLALAGCGLFAPAKSPMPSPQFSLYDAGPGGGAPGAAPPPPGAPGGPGSAREEVALAETAGGAAPTTPASAGPSATAGRKIITTGNMILDVENLSQALSSLARLVRTQGGFFANKSVSREDAWRTATVTIRVPAERFTAVHDGAVALGTVLRDEQSGEDVTRQWQDLEARLRIRKAKEARLIGLLGRQARLRDLLDVEKQLWQVREEIEVAEGELRFLRDQVALATLTVNLNEQVPVSVGPLGKWNLGYHFRNAFRVLGTLCQGLLTGLIYVVIAGVVIWLPLWLLVRWLLRRRRARRQSLPPPPAPDSG